MEQMLVTGGAGFIGTNFIHYLLTKTPFSGKIINVDALTYAGNPENLAAIAKDFPDRYHFIRADICAPDALKAVFDKFKISSICHFAAESHVDRSIASPDAFIQTNIIGTYNLLELARQYQDQVRLFHHVSTDEVFGSLGDSGYFKENTPYDPSSPYSASKAASDHLVRAYSRTYQIPVTISNCSNNYGPYQFPEKLIPLIFLNALEEKPLPVYGDGRNVRDWLYAEDHCNAIWEIMQKGVRGETYNIGGHSEMQNIEVVNMICDLLDELSPPKKTTSRRELISFVKDRPGHDRRYAIDCGKLEAALGWKPQESFASGLRKTVKWYLDNQKWVKAITSGTYQQWIEQHYSK